MKSSKEIIKDLEKEAKKQGLSNHQFDEFEVTCVHASLEHNNYNDAIRYVIEDICFEQAIARNIVIE